MIYNDEQNVGLPGKLMMACYFNLKEAAEQAVY